MDDERGDFLSEHECEAFPTGSETVSGDSKTNPVKAADIGEASGSGGHNEPVALSKKINELKAKQAAMLAERKKVTRDLRNHEKRRKRLKANARRLSDEDLAEVLRMREDTKKSTEDTESVPATSSTPSKKQKVLSKDRAEKV